jgi:ABC-type polysaccharide/polyol phosphate export permease
MLYDRRETIRFLVGSDLKSGHRDKVLGHLWNLLDPILFVGVYFLVFGVLFGQTARGQGSAFLTYLVVGVLAWRFTDGAVMQATHCIRGRRGLIHEISFPKAVFPVSICLSRLYDFMWGQLVLLLVLFITGTSLSLHILWWPLVVVLQLLFTMGLAMIVANLGAFFADTQNVVSVGMRLWFYASPLFYGVSDVVDKDGTRVIKGMIPEWVQPFFMLNPMACFFEAYRNCLLYARAPDAGHFLYITIGTVLTALLGFVVFTRGEGKFAKYI